MKTTLRLSYCMCGHIDDRAHIIIDTNNPRCLVLRCYSVCVCVCVCVWQPICVDGVDVVVAMETR